MTENALTRRKFLKYVGAATAGGAIAAALGGGYALFVERFDYELNEQLIFIRDLPEAFENFRIAQVSDLHHSRIVSLDEVQRVVQLAQSANADLIALTGDYVTDERRYIEPCVELLSSLRAPAGVWAVLGNHDHHADPKQATRTLRRISVEVLNNRHTVIRHRGDELQLVGVDDWSWGKLDWKQAQRGMDEARPSILLSHQPRVLDMEPALRHSLILSGHTHGGQVSFPLLGAPVRFTEEFKYISGLYVRERTQLFVTRGTGVVGLPVRFGAPPEISVIRLRRLPEMI